MSGDDRPNDPGSGIDIPDRAIRGDRLAADSDVTADQASREFGRSFEHSEHHSHLALLYEDQDEQFEAVVPFVRDGLERGDRCIYAYDDNTEAEVVAAMEAAGIDVDAAVERGQLSFHSKADPFLTDGTFDPDQTIDFSVETIEKATTEEGYDRVLLAGEMMWVLDDGHDVDQMIEYERALNSVYGPRPVVGLCQYNVSRFDPEILNQVIRSHPNLVYGGAVARDFYYLPTEDPLGGGRSEGNGDATQQTLLDRVTAYETLERRERALSALNDASRELMHLDAAEIPDRATAIVRDVLDVTFASMWAYDEHSGELELQSSASDRADVTALAALYRDRAWEVFVAEETQVCDELQSDSERETESSRPQLRSGVIVPLGRHGVFCAGSVRADAFDDVAVKLAKTLGTNVESALDRAERERTLTEKNDQLERVNRINRVIREISETLVEADTREEIERIVCERLAAADPYQFVWVGEREVETETIAARASAGDREEYLDEITISTDGDPTGRGPATTAMQTGSIQVVQDILTDPSFKPWREAALDEGFRACICIPLLYEELCYGVLTLYAGAPNSFDEMECAVLRELGEMIAHAVDAAETRETLQADSVVELTLSVQRTDDVLARLARTIGDEITFEGLVSRSDDVLQLFFTTQEAVPEDAVSRAEELDGVSEVRVLRNEATARTFAATVTEPTFASRIVDNHAVVRSLTVTGERATAVVDLPSPTDVRDFLDVLRRDYPAVDLVSRRTHDRPIRTARELREAVDAELTDRQRDVLETAYRSGFFESPRVRTGREISNSLDISQSTLTHHLREGERRLCEMVFENV